VFIHHHIIDISTDIWAQAALVALRSHGSKLSLTLKIPVIKIELIR
ncbi:MAG: hypothetical protein HW382_611, partial [Deltaproteobacteria bacterium]|nr:hypothetical protein [Deltaproteobacteria bacterium]